MSVKTVKSVREGKPFRPADIIVYAVLGAVIIALFTAFVFTRVTTPLTEIYVDVQGERALIWSVSQETPIITDNWSSRIEIKQTAKAYSVRVWADDEHTKYNDIEFTAESAKVIDSNCSARKDCVHTAAITDASGIIVCVPHRLKIYSSGERNPSLG